MKKKSLIMCLAAGSLISLVSCGGKTNPDKFSFSLSGDHIVAKLDGSTEEAKESINLTEQAKDTKIKVLISPSKAYGWKLPEKSDITVVGSSDYTYVINDNKKSATLELSLKTNTTVSINSKIVLDNLTDRTTVANLVDSFKNYKDPTNIQVKATVKGWDIAKAGGGDLNAENLDSLCYFINVGVLGKINASWEFNPGTSIISPETYKTTGISTRNMPLGLELIVKARDCNQNALGYKNDTILGKLFNADGTLKEDTSFGVYGDLFSYKYKMSFGPAADAKVGDGKLFVTHSLNDKGQIVDTNYELVNWGKKLADPGTFFEDLTDGESSQGYFKFNVDPWTIPAL